MNAPADLPESEKRKPGGQPGNANGARTRRIAARLTLDLLANNEADMKAIVKMLLKKAKMGESWAVKEVLDRVDGKVPQGVEMTGAGGGDLVIRDANTSIGVARRIAFALAQGAIAKAKAGPTPAQPKEDESAASA